MISIVLPTYNRAELLPRAIQSVLKQTYEDIELIVVDDASQDGTPQLMQSYADPRVRYLRMPENCGACAARNAGVRAAKGQWIAFQDSDDIWCEDKLERQLAHLQSTGADLVFCSFTRFKSPGEPGEVFPGPDLPEGSVSYEQLLSGNLISTQTLLGARSCFLEHPFDESFPRMQDWELVLRLAKAYRIEFQRCPLAEVYIQQDSISQRAQAGLQAYLKLFQMHREALLQTEQAYRHFAIGIATMEKGCGRNPWRRYFALICSKLSVCTNLYLLLHGVRALVRGY